MDRALVVITRRRLGTGFYCRKGCGYTVDVSDPIVLEGMLHGAEPLCLECSCDLSRRYPGAFEPAGPFVTDS